MNNKKILSPCWAILPLLFCSAAVLAGDGGADAPFGQIPAQTQGSLALEDEPAPVEAVPVEAAPDTMSQAQNLGQEGDGFLDDSSETSSLNTGYVGGNTRIGIGVDSELKGKADLSHVFRDTGSSATIGQGYVGVNPSADKDLGEETLTGAGVKLNHHWVSGDPNNASHVNKVFGAYDQNELKDKKVTAGYGQENADMFWSGHVSKGISDSRASTTPGVSEKAYDYGVGGRVGKYLPGAEMRVQGGLDHEWGKDFAESEKRPTQTTLTGGVEKFFPDTPHSVGAEVEVYKKSGGFVVGDDKAEARGGVSYRYDIGSEAGVWQPEQRYRRIRTEIPGEQIKQPPKIERKLVKNTMELEADTFFKLDSAKLTPEAQERMKVVIGQVRASGYEGNIRITGNTCDKGSDAHNQKLSENRANAVRDFMINNGFSGNELIAQGLGESQPKYPNTPTEGHKNRRVDIEYVTYQNEYKDEVIEQGGTSVTDPKVVWHKELIPEPPIWVRQALRNTVDHKQTVDTYKTTAGTGGPVTPVAGDDSATTKSGILVSIDVLKNDSDPNGDTLTIVSFNQGSNGAVTQVGNNLVYTPVASFTGTDTFTYVITDPAGHQSTATVTVTVGAVDPNTPIAVNDSATTTSGTAVDIDVLGNDRDPNGDTLSIASFDPTSDKGGTVTQSGTKLTYTPAAGFTGTDTFTYVVTDPAGNKATAIVTITVTGLGNVAPVAKDDTGETTSGKEVAIDVLGNDSDADGDTLTVVRYDQGANGSVKLVDGKLVYTPLATFVGTDSFDYVITDPAGHEAKATVTVTVKAPTPNTPPVGNADTGETVTGTAVTIPVLDNDTDADGDKLSIASYAQAAHGTVTQDGDKLIYTPAAGFTDTDTFTYVVQDSAGNKGNEATVTITCACGDDGNVPPVATADTAESTSGTPVPIAVLANDTDADGDKLSVVSFTQGAKGGTVTQSGDTLTYTPKADFTGTDTFEYVITDTADHKVTGTVTVTVKTPPPNTPMAVNDLATKLPIPLNDTTPKTLDVLANDNGEGLTIVAIPTKPAYGTAEISADGKSIIYTLRSGYCIDHSFTYTVRDKNGKEATATVWIDVEPTNITDPNSPPA